MKTLQLSNEAYAKVQRLLKQGGNSALVEAVEKELSSLPQSSQKGIYVIDENPALDRASRTQQNWIPYFNEQGELMIAPENILESKGNARASLQKDCREHLVVTGTGIDYISNSLEGTIAFNRGSKVVPETHSGKIVIPVFTGTPLPEALKSKEGLRYHVLLFNERFTTEKKLTDALADFSGRKPEDIYTYTPDQGRRNRYPKRAVGFNVNSGWFHVVGYCIFGVSCGLSRGVRLNSEPKARTK